jgi:hypothetical protein
VRTVIQDEILQCQFVIKKKKRIIFQLVGFSVFATKPCDSQVELSVPASKDEHACLLVEMLNSAI